ncbi:helix-turn-helix domain-containing protein [Paraferrimonas haliotis]|uniref:HTH merR-type domain-containing protein n=1 Tax=Paraferrimonas haliotis TaxID=2013866 RepID=A0AA37WWM6_9GAMM|nr:helix-turn-helix domain-containing protein [Paraferrimonas haliotis]GLS83687.1 hypothetical protein GCM10007894_16640 [Paraferrimonas haliotis]
MKSIDPNVQSQDSSSLTLEQLSIATDTPLRTIRFYIQKGMVDRPLGARKSARYSEKHLEQVLTIRKWQGAGMSLEAIHRLLNEESPQQQQYPEPEPGQVRVVSHITLCRGIDLVVDPQQSGLTSQQLRQLSSSLADLLEQVKG